MTKDDKMMQRWNDALASDPRKCPVGFFLQDIQSDPCAAGGFLWYESQGALFMSIRTDLPCALDQDADVDEIASALARTLDSISFKKGSADEQLCLLNTCLADAKERIEFLGTFEQLCNGTGDWASGVRKQYREYAMDDSEELLDDALTHSIEIDEVDDFVAYIYDFRCS